MLHSLTIKMVCCCFKVIANDFLLTHELCLRHKVGAEGAKVQIQL